MTARTKAPAASTWNTPELRARVLDIHDRLCAAYGCPVPFFSDKDPMSELVSALLSHRTRNRDSHRAYLALRDRWPTWEAVRDAAPADVEEAVSPCTWPEQKAPRIQAVLRAITGRRGSLDLDFLADLPPAEARSWLESIPGVGPKTSAAVLLFSRLRVAALPVDSHHHRVASRLGLLPPGVDVGPSHAILAGQLPPSWTAQQVYDNHEVLMIHGQKCCHHARPSCDRCPVLELCPTGKARLWGDDPPPVDPAPA